MSLFNSVDDPAQEKCASLQRPLSNGVTGSQCSPVPSPCPSSLRSDPMAMTGERARWELSGAGRRQRLQRAASSSTCGGNKKRTVGTASATMERRNRNSWQLCVYCACTMLRGIINKDFIKSLNDLRCSAGDAL